jgi:hypothetical protein
MYQISSSLRADVGSIRNLILHAPLTFNSPQLEIDENKTNNKNAMLLLLANRYSNTIWSYIPYDIVKIIAKKVSEPTYLTYLPVFINGKKYRLKLGKNFNFDHWCLN